MGERSLETTIWLHCLSAQGTRLVCVSKEPNASSHLAAVFNSYVAFRGGAWQPFTEAGGQRDVFAACESQARADEE